MGNALFSWPQDNISTPLIGGGAEWEADTETEHPDYPARYLSDGNPARPGKLLGTTGAFIRDLSEPKKVDYVALIHHNLSPGAVVWIQAHDQNIFTETPPLQMPIQIPAYKRNGFPVNPFVDLTGLAQRTFRFWRIFFVTPNSAPIAIGEIWMGSTKRQLYHNYAWGVQRRNEQASINRVTDMRIRHVFTLGTDITTYRGMIQGSFSNLAEQQVQDWWDAAHGTTLPFFFALDSDTNNCMMAYFDMEGVDFEYATYNDTPMELVLSEMSRGLVL